jgi:iron complex transport system ATP-binding protein
VSGVPVSPAVVAEQLVLAYGRTIALAESSFAIPAGAVTAVIGPNGSGKSTVLNAIAGLMRPASGRLELPRRDGRAPGVAYVMQATKVNEALPVTAGEVVAMGRYAGKGMWRRFTEVDRDAIDRAMSAMALQDLADRHYGRLSGGQRQRVLVAQGLAQDHDILLLDEPLSGLDMPSAERIDAVIHDEYRHGRSVIVSTHDLAEARVADHVLLLSGRVVASGSPEEVLTAEHLTAAYGPSLLHVEELGLMIDDPAHRPVPGRHVHRDRSIHVEPPGADLHE